MGSYTSDKENNPQSVAEAAVAYDTPFKKIHLSRSGLNSAFVNDLMSKYGFSKAELARLIDVSPKTIERHFQADKTFTGLQAERLLLLAELYQQGSSVFGSQVKFLKWLNHEIAALEGSKPRSWLDTHHGIQIISDEIGRIQHGIFS